MIFLGSPWLLGVEDASRLSSTISLNLSTRSARLVRRWRIYKIMSSYGVKRNEILVMIGSLLFSVYGCAGSKRKPRRSHPKRTHKPRHSPRSSSSVTEAELADSYPLSSLNEVRLYSNFPSSPRLCSSAVKNRAETSILTTSMPGPCHTISLTHEVT